MSTEFDEQMKDRLRAFQRAHGLADSGVADSTTWGKLAGEPPPEQGTQTTPAAGQGGIPFYINPDVFDFAPDPKADNWQTTSCVPIVFGYGSPFLPMTKLTVGVVVGAPITLRDGKKISVREAQLDSANAAQAAAEIIKTMLDSGTIGTSEVQPRFVGFMGGAIQATGLGYRVKGCHPARADNDQTDDFANA